jgi:hypothetical protein
MSRRAFLAGLFTALVSAAPIALTVVAAAQPRTASATVDQPVSVALVLAVDVSTSINDERFRLQREGYANAFRHPAILEAIRNSEHRRIAVTYFEWSGANHQQVIVPWTIVGDAESGAAVADQLTRAPRPFDGWTSISAALDFAVTLIDTSPYREARRVVDVSGDGDNNDGRPVVRARDAAVARGIVINGLAIMTETPDPGEGPLDEFYRDNVVGGPGAFVLVVDSFDTFAYGIVNKIVREVAGLPLRTRLAGLDRPFIRIGGPGQRILPTIPNLRASLR